MPLYSCFTRRFRDVAFAALEDFLDVPLLEIRDQLALDGLERTIR